MIGDHRGAPAVELDMAGLQPAGRLVGVLDQDVHVGGEVGDRVHRVGDAGGVAAIARRPHPGIGGETGENGRRRDGHAAFDVRPAADQLGVGGRAAGKFLRRSVKQLPRFAGVSVDQSHHRAITEHPRLVDIEVSVKVGVVGFVKGGVCLRVKRFREVMRAAGHRVIGAVVDFRGLGREGLDAAFGGRAAAEASDADPRGGAEPAKRRAASGREGSGDKGSRRVRETRRR